MERVFCGSGMCETRMNLIRTCVCMCVRARIPIRDVELRGGYIRRFTMCRPPHIRHRYEDYAHFSPVH